MPTTEARSARPRYAAVLAAEVELIWFKPEGLELPWIRECFPHGAARSHGIWESGHWPHASTFRKPLWTPSVHTYAVTLAANGHVCREFLCSQRSLDAYAKLDVLPIEAVLPGSIAVGKPATAAPQPCTSTTARG
jgi:hypothetical protein